MNSLNSDSKFVRFILVAILVALIAIVAILGCFGLVILAVSGMEGGYPVPNIDDEASKYADRTPQWSAGAERLVVNVGHRVLGVNVSGGEPFDVRGKRGRKQYSVTRCPPEHLRFRDELRDRAGLLTPSF